jgi:2-keto-4-pentenoate hydratase/2-oxohepta-3-ene-1,7-dioic acid hydratase in catechol pathway
MRWSTYRSSDGRERVGVWHEDRLYAAVGARSLIELLGDDGERLREAGEAALRSPAEVADPATVELLAPIPRPPSIRDFMAFEQHVVTASEAIGLTVDPLWYEQPVFYFTNPAAVCGPVADVAVPPGSAALDYELEIAAVVGRAGGDLDPARAADHIAGYVLFCDWSARDLQAREMRLNLGPAKGKDFANGFGPWMLTPDELPDDVAMTATVGDRLYSSGRLSDLHWSFGEMIAYASRGTTVVPGDVIGSGTVGTGCILELSRVHGADAYPYLEPGDRVRLAADRLGTIEARVVAGRPARPLRPEAAR